MSRAPLRNSGIMTSYVCSAKCRHCLYCSTPSIPKQFMTADAAERICASLERAGALSMHIGGGEPFLDFESLCATIEAMNRHGIAVDYIETNASWCTGEQRVRERLHVLKQLGVRCVMVSVDPFHIEFVPLERPLMLVRELRAAGFDYFIWQERFLRRLLPLDHARPMPHAELKAVLSEHYVEDAAREYGLGVNGRALRIAHSLYKKKPASKLFSSTPCHLLDSNHCHVDLFENVVPAGCPGIAIPLHEFLSGSVPQEKYPVAARLLSGGLNALYAYAQSHGFLPDETGYVTKCELCYATRAHLLAANPTPDIGPDCFYQAMAEV